MFKKQIMYLAHVFLHTLVPAFSVRSPSTPEPCECFLLKYSIVPLGNATSTIPNIFRDGGGGGKIDGLNFIWFADGITTTGGKPGKTPTNWINFTSNSIAHSGYNGGGPNELMDFGINSPPQQIPYFYENGESDSKTGIWPNQNFASLCDGRCGVGFPPVISRAASDGVLLYNTGVKISIGPLGPIISRPVQALFYATEPQFGTFSSFTGIDGYLYTFAAISNTIASNGLKLARVPSSTPFTRSAYQYWNGAAFGTTMPAIDDGGVANILNFTTEFYGQQYGPSSGDFFYSTFYGVFMIIFGAADAAVDSNVYLIFSPCMTHSWTTPVAIYETPRLTGGYNYNVHAYPLFDVTSKVVPISWTQFDGKAYYNAFANVTFS